MSAAANLALLATSVLAWFAVWPLLGFLMPTAPRNARFDWYQIGGYAAIALWGGAAVALEPMRFQLSAAPGPISVALVYAYFGFMVVGGLLMIRVPGQLRSVLTHHGVFALLPLFCVFGGYWVELCSWLFITQFTGGVHAIARIVLRRDPSLGRMRAMHRLEWGFLVAVRGALAGGLTLAFVVHELAHPTYQGIAWTATVGALVAAIVVFPLYWTVPMTLAALRRFLVIARRREHLG
jgi:hypothetical protein